MPMRATSSRLQRYEITLKNQKKKRKNNQGRYTLYARTDTKNMVHKFADHVWGGISVKKDGQENKYTMSDILFVKQNQSKMFLHYSFQIPNHVKRKIGYVHSYYSSKYHFEYST